YWPGLARRDIGQLTVGNISETSTYCRYTITAAYPNEGFEAFYRNGDQICIACGDSWPAGAAADGAQECPERIRFTAQSGDVQYDANKVLGVNSCTECPASEVRGVYETP
ncbi:MAG: hypothetical protein KDD36_14810, partial [Flavobacteriales bacterium]|nr:hypothetical protein [Flavobacteriales bacterium]